MKPSLIVDAKGIGVTQAFLRGQGAVPQGGHEGVVLWLGAAEDRIVTEVLIPEQLTGIDYFDVPLAERQRIVRSLAGTERVLLCQVHSHPGRAWHSPVDDSRALPRHVGALSLVVPDLGRRSSIQDGAALYELATDGRWLPRSFIGIDLEEARA